MNFSRSPSICSLISAMRRAGKPEHLKKHVGKTNVRYSEVSLVLGLRVALAEVEQVLLQGLVTSASVKEFVEVVTLFVLVVLFEDFLESLHKMTCSTHVLVGDDLAVLVKFFFYSWKGECCITFVSKSVT